jgi:gliding motility-associated-like protein
MKTVYTILNSLKSVLIIFTSTSLLNLNLVISQEMPEVMPEPIFGFVENKGQITNQNHEPNPEVLFLLQQRGMNIQIRKTGFSYDTYRVINDIHSHGHNHNHQELVEKIKRHEPISPEDEVSEEFADSLVYHFARLDIEFLNTSDNMTVTAVDPLSDYTNYYTNKDQMEGILRVKSFQKILISNLYDGIHLEYIINKSDHTFKYNFIVDPGADVSQIKWIYKGADGEILSDLNVIQLKLNYPELNEVQYLQEQIPSSYYLGTDSKIDVKYSQKDGVFSFLVPELDHSRTFIIDPAPQVEWATYYGGTAGESTPVADLASDQSANVYMAGTTSSANNIATAGSFNSIYTAMNDVYFVKFNPAGVRLWATYYGGTANDRGHSITVDNSDFVYVAGETGSDVIFGTVGSHQPARSGGIDAFISKFDASGTRIWGTYYGGPNTDVNWVGFSYGFFATVRYASNGFIYFSSSTNSTTNISTPGTYQTALNGTAYDAYVVKFDLNGVRQWGTYFGGSANDYSCEVAVDNVGNLTIVGGTFSTDLPLLNAYQPINLTSGFYRTGFVTTFNSTATALNWSTFLGGSGLDHITSCQYDLNNDLAIGSFTVGSYDFPVTVGCFQPTFTGSCCGIVGKFSPLGMPYWITFYGGSDEDHGFDVSVDATGIFFFSGETTSPAMLATPCSHQEIMGGGYDAFLAKIDGNGNRIWGTYYGGANSEKGFRNLPDNAQRIYLSGYTSSTTGIATPGSHQPALGGGIDHFLAKFYDCNAPEKPIISNDTSICEGGSATLAIISGNLNDASVWNWYSGTCGGVPIGSGTSITVNPATTTSYFVKAEGACSACDCDTVIVSVNSLPSFVSVTSSNNLITCLNSSSTLDAVCPGASTTWTGGILMNAPSPAVVTSGGVYSVIATDLLTGCTIDSSLTILDNLLPPTITSATNSGDITCVDLSSTLTAVSAGNTLVWNGGALVNAANPATANAAGTYTVTATDPINGCTSTATTTVNTNTTAPTITSATNSGDITCVNLNSTLTAVSAGNTLVWNGGVLVNAANPANVNAAGTYTVTATDPINGCTSTATTTVNTNTTSPTITSAINSGDITCVNLNSTLTAVSAGNTLVWNGGALVNAANPASANAAGTYTVTATDPINGCTTTATTTVNANTTAPTITSAINNGDITCLNLTSTLTAVSAGNTLVWNGGALVNAANPATANAGGTYTVTATDPINGCTSTATTTVIANTTPPIITSATNSGDITCVNLASTLTAVSAGNTLVWNGGALVNAANPATANAGGTYTVTATDPINGCTSTATTTVIANTTPPIITSATNSGDITCVNLNSTLTAVSAGNTLVWNGGALINAANPATANAAGTYTVTATDPINGCTNTATTTVNTNTTPPVADAGADQTICENTSTLFSVNPQSNTVITWDGGVVNGVLFTPPVGTSTYTLTVTDLINGCISTDQVNVLVNSLPVVLFSGDNLTGCAPLTVNFSNLTIPSGDNCTWNFGNGTTATGCGNTSATYTSSGVYDVTLTVSSGGCSSSLTLTDYITVEQQAEAYFAFNSSTLSMDDTELHFENESMFSDSYIWSFGDGSGNSQLENPTHLFPAEPNTSYTVTLIAINAAGCNDTTTAVISISDELIFYIPNAFTPDGNEINNSFFPVFTSGYDPYDYHLTIFNRWGEIVFESYNAATGWDGTYADQGLVEDGVYIWQIDFKETMSDKRYTQRGHVTVLK